MEYVVNNFKDVFESQKDYGDTVVNSEKLRIEKYHLNKGAAVNFSFDADEECHIIVLSGEVEVRFLTKNVPLSSGECFSIYEKNAFTVLAKNSASFLIICNLPNGSIDNQSGEVLKMIRRQEKDDTYLVGHGDRVGMYTIGILNALEPNKNWAQYQFAATAHDVGKIKIPSEILNKAGRLTSEEYEIIKKHPIYSYEILRDYFDDDLAKAARWHHERNDGSGYPDGLKEEQIPLVSKVMAIADVFDALTTNRSYRKAYPFEMALEIMQSDVEHNKLDARCFEVFKKLVEEGFFKQGFDDLFSTVLKENWEEL